MKKGFSGWNDFIQSNIPFEEKLEMLRSSNIFQTNPGLSRKKVWEKLIPPYIFTTLEEYYQGTLTKSWFPTNFPNSYEKIEYIVLTRNVASKKHIKNITSAIMQSITDEKLGFIVTCYIIENLYPRGFFHHKPTVRSESLKFVELAKLLRPKLLKAMTITYREKESKQLSTSSHPFAYSMSQLSSFAFLKFFPFLLDDEKVRLIDYLLIFNFEIFSRFLVALISSQEGKVIQSIKKNAKGLEIRSDLLFYTGIYAIIENLMSGKKNNIEALLKKAAKKNTYVKVNINFLNIGEYEDFSISYRIKKAKTEFEQFLYENIQNLVERIKSGSSEDQIMLSDLKKVFDNMNIEENLLYKILSLLIHSFSLKASIYQIIVVLVLLGNFPLEEKFKLLFTAFSSENSTTLPKCRVVELAKLLDSLTSSELLDDYSFDFEENINYLDFLQEVHSKKEFFEIFELFDEEISLKSNKGSYVQSNSYINASEKVNVESDPDQFSLSEDEGDDMESENIEALPEVIEVKEDRSKCVRLCSGNCLVF